MTIFSIRVRQNQGSLTEASAALAAARSTGRHLPQYLLCGRPGVRLLMRCGACPNRHPQCVTASSTPAVPTSSSTVWKHSETEFKTHGCSVGFGIASASSASQRPGCCSRPEECSATTASAEPRADSLGRSVLRASNRRRSSCSRESKSAVAIGADADAALKEAASISASLTYPFTASDPHRPKS